MIVFASVSVYVCFDLILIPPPHTHTRAHIFFFKMLSCSSILSILKQFLVFQRQLQQWWGTSLPTWVAQINFNEGLKFDSDWVLVAETTRWWVGTTRFLSCQRHVNVMSQVRVSYPVDCHVMSFHVMIFRVSYHVCHIPTMKMSLKHSRMPSHPVGNACFHFEERIGFFVTIKD